MNNPYGTNPFSAGVRRRTFQDEYDQALGGDPSADPQNPYNTGRPRPQRPTNPYSYVGTSAYGGGLQSGWNGVSPTVQATMPGGVPQTDSFGNQAALGDPYQETHYDPLSGTWKPGAGPGIASDVRQMQGPSPQELSYYNDLLAQGQLDYAKWLSLVSGQYQTMDANGNPIGNPMLTQAAKQQFIQNFGYDPETHEQSLAGQLQQANLADRLIQQIGTFAATSHPQAPGFAGQQMGARDEITQERVQAQEAGAQRLKASMAQQQPMPQPQTMGPGVGFAAPWQGHVGGPTTVVGPGTFDRPADIRPAWQSGPASSMSVDQGAANTMRGNLAFGLHPTRDNVRQGAPGGADDRNSANYRSQQIAFNPDESQYTTVRDHLLNQSPFRDAILRGEDIGRYMTPELVALQGMIRRRLANGLPV